MPLGGVPQHGKTQAFGCPQDHKESVEERARKATREGLF
jgi:hypothetical protein